MTRRKTPTKSFYESLIKTFQNYPDPGIVEIIRQLYTKHLERELARQRRNKQNV